MARRRDIIIISAAGLAQGLALITFPAASAVFTSAAAYGLTSTEYGGLFVPQAVTAIGASLCNGALTRRIGAERVYLLGLGANLLAMALLVLSMTALREHGLAYGILLAATASMGLAFGWTVPVLNAFAVQLLPARTDAAVLGLNALLGLGTVLAPLLVALFVALGHWWGLPVLVAMLVLGLACAGPPRSLAGQPVPGRGPATGAAGGMTGRLWLFASFAILYGVVETMNANWASLYMSGHFHAGPTLAALTLTLFWGMVTGGRIIVATASRWLPGPLALCILPLIVALAFASGATIPAGDPLWGALAFAVAGLGCSALLPLSISLSQAAAPANPAAVAGCMIAAYQIGYGIAAFGAGPLQSRAGLGLAALYAAAAVIALAMSLLAVVIVRTRRGVAPAAARTQGPATAPAITRAIHPIIRNQPP